MVRVRVGMMVVRMAMTVTVVMAVPVAVMMVVAVLSIHGIVSNSFRNNSSFGYNMIVGAKGGKLQLTLPRGQQSPQQLDLGDATLQLAGADLSPDKFHAVFQGSLGSIWIPETEASGPLLCHRAVAIFRGQGGHHLVRD